MHQLPASLLGFDSFDADCHLYLSMIGSFALNTSLLVLNLVMIIHFQQHFDNAWSLSSAAWIKVVLLSSAFLILLCFGLLFGFRRSVLVTV